MTQILVSVLSSLRALGCCFGCLAGFAGSSFGTAGGYGTLLPPTTSFVLGRCPLRLPRYVACHEWRYDAPHARGQRPAPTEGSSPLLAGRTLGRLAASSLPFALSSSVRRGFPGHSRHTKNLSWRRSRYPWNNVDCDCHSALGRGKSTPDLHSQRAWLGGFVSEGTSARRWKGCGQAAGQLRSPRAEGNGTKIVGDTMVVDFPSHSDLRQYASNVKVWPRMARDWSDREPKAVSIECDSNPKSSISNFTTKQRCRKIEVEAGDVVGTATTRVPNFKYEEYGRLHTRITHSLCLLKEESQKARPAGSSVMVLWKRSFPTVSTSCRCTRVSATHGVPVLDHAPLVQLRAGGLRGCGARRCGWTFQSFMSVWTGQL